MKKMEKESIKRLLNYYTMNKKPAARIVLSDYSFSRTSKNFHEFLACCIGTTEVRKHQNTHNRGYWQYTIAS